MVDRTGPTWLEKMQAANSRITVPDGPGLGVTINEDFVQAHLTSEPK